MSGALATLIELAARRCDAAAKAVAGQLAAQRTCALKGQMLTQYRAEYVARQAAASKAGTDGATLRNLAGFLAKLDEASAQNELEGVECAARVAGAQESWTAARRTLEGYEALVRRNEGRIALKARRIEQRQQDEFAARTTRTSTGDHPK